MNDLRMRLALVETTLQAPLSDKDKLIGSLKKLSGLNLTPLSTVIRNALERHLASVNHILRQYDIQTWDDYDNISPQHLKKMLQGVRRLNTRLTALLDTVA